MINELVQRLSEGKHEVVIGHRDVRWPNLSRLKCMIHRDCFNFEDVL